MESFEGIPLGKVIIRDRHPVEYGGIHTNYDLKESHGKVSVVVPEEEAVFWSRDCNRSELMRRVNSTDPKYREYKLIKG